MFINLLLCLILIFNNLLICSDNTVKDAIANCFEKKINSLKIPINSNLASERQLKVAQRYGDPEYKKLNYRSENNSLKNQDKSAISRDSKLASVRQMRLSQRYGDPEYTKFESSSIMRFYGFVAYELIFITRQDVEDVAIGEYIYPAQYLPDVNNKDINAHGQTIMDAAGSRFGIFFNPFQNGGLNNIYAILEFDFRGTIALNKYTAKIRQSFGEIAWKNGSFLFGQYYHPLFLAESFPRVINYNLGAPFEPQCLCPQLRITQMWGPCEFMFSLISQAYLSSYGPTPSNSLFPTIVFPPGPSASYIENAIVPNINFEFKWRIKDNFYGFSLDYLRIVPRLSSIIGSANQTSANFKVNEQVNSINFEVFLHNVFPKGELNFNFIFTQNGSNQLLISGYGVKTVSNFTGYQTYSPTNAIAIWMDAFYIFHKKEMQLGFFFGYTLNLGSFTDLYITPLTSTSNPGQPTVYGLEDSAPGILYLYRIAPRYVYDIGSLRIGAELQWDVIAYGAPFSQSNPTPMLNKKGVPVNPIPVNAFLPILIIEYPF